MERYSVDVNKETHEILQGIAPVLVKRKLIPRPTKYYVTKLALSVLIDYAKNEIKKEIS